MDRTTRQKKLPVLWVNCTTSDGIRVVPRHIHRHFEVHIGRCESPVGSLIDTGNLAAVFVDYDFPDREKLRFAVDLKRRYPSLPIFVSMVQHSEALALWALRSRMTDFLVKPITPRDIARVLQIVTETWQLRQKQQARSVREGSSELPAETRLDSRNSLLPAIYYVQQHYGEKITLEDVAAHCAMKPHRFSRLFHSTYRVTFRDYVVRYRLREAKRLLQDPQISVSEVAETVGFNDLSYFSRMFKRHFGHPPSAVLRAGPKDESQGDDEGSTTIRMLRLPVVH